MIKIKFILVFFLISSFYANSQEVEKIKFSFTKEQYGDHSEFLNQIQQSPSFNCAAKLNNVELLICNDPRLAVVDRLLNDLYREVKKPLSKDEQGLLQNNQIKWIKNRNLCATQTCIVASYKKRALDLELQLSNVTLSRSQLIAMISLTYPDIFSVLLPEENDAHEEIKFLVSGQEHTCIASSKKVKCWGNNSGKVLNVPNQLFSIEKLVTGGTASACVLDAGTPICWGTIDNKDQIENKKLRVDDISAGGTYLCYLQSGAVKCLGDEQLNKTKVPADLLSAKSIVSSNTFSCAIQKNDKLKCWGDNSFKQLEVPDVVDKIKKVELGSSHGCALTVTGKIICWGAGRENTGDFPNFGQSKVPFSEAPFIDLAVGYQHTCGLTTEKVLCWGNNTDGQSMPLKDIRNVSKLSAGSRHTCGLTDQGVRCWGKYWSDDFKTNFLLGRDHPITFESDE
jgi:alpha-tubulin suppressor-like RCC1 family protein